MSGSGFMSLAYMAELGVVVNLAYLELKSLRYLGDAKKYIEETTQSLQGESVKNGNHNQHIFIDLHKQVRELFSDDKTQRDAAWYVVSSGVEKKYFKGCSGIFYERFYKERDRVWSTRYLCAATLVIVLMTLITQIASEGWVGSTEGVILWWSFFATLFLSIAVPACYIMMGRRLNKVSRRIMDDIRERKNQIAKETFNGILAGNIQAVPKRGE